MMAEIVMARTFVMDLDTLAGMAFNTGKDQVTRFDMATLMADDDESDDFSDGI